MKPRENRLIKSLRNDIDEDVTSEGYSPNNEDEDIINNYSEETEIDPNDLFKIKIAARTHAHRPLNEMDLEDDVSQADLYSQASEEDDEQEYYTDDDEESNFYNTSRDDNFDGDMDSEE